MHALPSGFGRQGTSLEAHEAGLKGSSASRVGSGSLVQVVEQAAMMHESSKAAWILMKWGFFIRAICGYGLKIRV